VRGVNGPAEDAFFSLIDREIAGHERIEGARLHFNENQDLAIACDQVDLIPAVAGAPPIARDDGEAMPALEKIRRRSFALSSGVISPV